VVNYANIRVKSSLEVVRDQVRQLLEQNKFKLTWENDRKGKAEMGGFFGKHSKNASTGGYYFIDFEISGIGDSWNLRLTDPTYQIRNPLGLNNWMIKYVKKQFEQIVEALANRFSSQGLIIEVVKS